MDKPFSLAYLGGKYWDMSDTARHIECDGQTFFRNSDGTMAGPLSQDGKGRWYLSAEVTESGSLVFHLN
jgi:hypothetical protein